ncbi:MAG: TPM domain-containing protein [Cryobacterium sp.]|uniref:TPM domain-containing protein n=1 Tax=Cryobacterium sp. TaxID=1926290 RepID=UPI0022882341|nr:TPM domain-containing protein [Cryobacterium sp.]MCY7403556.1 TPM domain-containing protein [Cryobacterium sp.]
MRAFVALGAGLLALIVGAGASTVAYATAPVDFGASHVVDSAGVLGDRAAEVTNRLDQLFSDTQIDLYVAFVGSFTNPSDREQWADQVISQNGMGTNDILLAVATDDREYQLRVTPGFPLTASQLSDVQLGSIEPALRDSDWAGAALAAADGLAAGVSGQGQPETGPGNPSDGQVQPDAGQSGGGGAIFSTVIVLIGIGLIFLFIVRRRRRRASPVARVEPQISTEQLGHEAGRALVQTDDAVKTSGQELGFATAQYGEASTKPFHTALAQAQQKLLAAFTLQQKLDDAEPDSDEQRRAWFNEIGQLCALANALLDEQTADFDELRQVAKNAPAVAASVAQKLAELQSRVPRAEQELASLASRYTEVALATVADNPAQARERITFASEALGEARARLEASDSGAAAVTLRAAEESVDQGELLLEAIDRLSSGLGKAVASIAPLVADLENDLRVARSIPSQADAGANLPGVIALTEQCLSETKTRLASGPVNPLELGQRLESVNAQMDAVLKGVRDATERARRVRTALDQTLLSARGQVSAAEDFIGARRGAIGPESRTRLAEATRFVALAEAQAGVDPEAALAAAQRGNALAAEANALARKDVDGYGNDDDFFGGGRGSRGSNGSLGAALGGILIGSLLSGGFGGFGGGGGFGDGGNSGGGGGFGGGGDSGGGGSF